jgi:hypothetical protein
MNLQITRQQLNTLKVNLTEIHEIISSLTPVPEQSIQSEESPKQIDKPVKKSEPAKQGPNGVPRTKVTSGFGDPFAGTSWGNSKIK